MGEKMILGKKNFSRELLGKHSSEGYRTQAPRAEGMNSARGSGCWAMESNIVYWIKIDAKIIDLGRDNPDIGKLLGI